MYKEKLSHIVPENVILDDVFSLYDANTATFQTDTQSQLIVKPQSVEDIVRIISFAVKNQLKVYTVSQGKNWGFGSKVPVKDAMILLDLSSMNRIISYDKTFGTVRVEPGVTFRQLSEYLVKEGGNHFLNTIGGDPEASVLGNILERGDGVGPYCERSEYACHLQVVLANGNIVETGFGNIKNSRVANLCKTGVGPGFQELFFQSNFGVVTQLTLWLQPVPKFFRTFSFALPPSQRLSQILERIRSLYHRRILHSPITWWNDYKQLAVKTPLNGIKKGSSTLDRTQIQQLSNNYSTWYAFGGVYVDHRSIGKAQLHELFTEIRPYIKRKNYWSQLSTRKISMLRVLNKLMGGRYMNFSQILESWDRNHLLGHSSGNSIKSLYWRKKGQVPTHIDPGAELCGVLWNTFLIPFDGKLIEQVLENVDKIIIEHGFEPIISFITLNDRYVKVFQQLLFDREVEGEDSAALSCHSTVFQYVEEMGCTHTRLDILHMEAGKTQLKETILHKTVKQALDPEGILSPGRYFC